MNMQIMRSVAGTVAAASVLMLVGSVHASRAPAREILQEANPSFEQTSIPEACATYRHDWGDINNGVRILSLLWPDITANTRAFVSIAEGYQGNKMLGNVRFIIYNTVPRDGAIDIRVEIVSDGAADVIVDYLVCVP